MRKISFRAWDKISKTMLSWEELCSDKNALRLNVVRTGTNLHWLQFTGLLDKNGLEIYEGDIVRRKTGNSSHSGYYRPREVKWRTSDFYSGWNLGGKTDRLEVIGNLYETPSLLEPLTLTD